MDVFMKVLEATVPVFGIIGFGAWLGGWRSIHGATLAELALMVTSPALIFSVFAGIQMEARDAGLILGAAAWVMLGTGGLVCVLSRGLSRGPSDANWKRTRAMLLPAVFWNAGNMGLPISHLAFGDFGLEIATVFFVSVAILQSVIGLPIAKGRGALRETVYHPLFLASSLGFLVAILNIEIPKLVLTPIAMVGDMAIPLMLLNLGIQLRQLRVGDLHSGAVSVAVRMLGGVCLAYAFCRIFGLEGDLRNVVILSGVLPPAVINIVIAQRYDLHPNIVASAIVLGTLFGIIAIPGVLYLLLMG